jgi:hypothetical protein
MRSFADADSPGMVRTKTSIELADAPLPAEAELEDRAAALVTLLEPLASERPGGVRVEELAERLQETYRDTRALLEYMRHAAAAADGSVRREALVERVTEDPSGYWRSRYVLTAAGRLHAHKLSA